MTTNNSWNNQVANADVSFTGGTFSVGTDATSGAINIGTGAAARTTTIGNTTGASQLDLKTGTGDFSLASASGNMIQGDDVGFLAFPRQSGFAAYKSADSANVTGDDTNYTIICDTERFDTQGEYNTGTGVFTATKTGIYLLCGNIGLGNIGAAHNYCALEFFVGGSSVQWVAFNPNNFKNNDNVLTFPFSRIINLTAGDQCTIRAVVGGGTKTITAIGGAIKTFFTAFKLA